MRLEPDCDQAAAEQRGIKKIVRAVLTRIGFSDLDDDLLLYPGLIAVVNEVQRLNPDATVAQRSAATGAVQAALAAAEMSRQRARGLDHPVWAVDLPPVESHLNDSLDRALAQIPVRPDRVIDVRVADWMDADRVVFGAAVGLLTEFWPEMLAELAVGIRQVALLRGYGITGFSDFAVQGAVFVNAERLDDRDGLPGALRLAENLVHEGAHTRCYCAAAAEPFLDPGRVAVQVATPLRADPRPLFGLFQQLVVLCRCAELYRRAGFGTERRGAVRARCDALVTQAQQAVHSLNTHADQLTDHGRAILGEATGVVGADAPAAR